MIKIFLCMFVLCIAFSGCTNVTSRETNNTGFIPVINSIEESAFNTSGNHYFFQSESINVKCEMNILHAFKGEAILLIKKIEGTKINGFYELTLTDLNGRCDMHKNINEYDCEFSNSFTIGYIYADSEYIYMMSYDTRYLDIFRETEVFPPSQEYIDNWNGKLFSSGEHYGYFSYRLVCSEDGFHDTFESNDSLDSDYHNLISVNGNQRRYNLWPETSGTKEHLYIFWEEGKGLVFYASWAGSLKNYISFYDLSFEGQSMIEWIP